MFFGMGANILMGFHPILDGDSEANLQNQLLTPQKHLPSHSAKGWRMNCDRWSGLGEDRICHQPLCYGDQEIVGCLGQAPGRWKQAVHLWSPLTADHQGMILSKFLKGEPPTPALFVDWLCLFYL